MYHDLKVNDGRQLLFYQISIHTLTLLFESLGSAAYTFLKKLILFFRKDNQRN